jgi:uncharacterized membrane protein YphA (DoxX/SURF4 family)
MIEIGSASGFVLGVIFIWAASSKLASRSRTASSFRMMNLPAASFLATAVPLAELGVAVALVVRPRVGGILAIAMLAAFTLILRRAIAKGSHASCACFGSASTDPITWVELARNAMLSMLAIAAIAVPGEAQHGLAAWFVVIGAVVVGSTTLALLRLVAKAGRLWRTTLDDFDSAFDRSAPARDGEVIDLASTEVVNNMSELKP